MKNKIFYIIFIFFIFSLGVYAASTIPSSSVSYGNSNTVSGALDELYNLSDIRKSPNIIVGYTYNQTSGASNYCVTGDEETCQETKCYESTETGSCPAGTIIVYKVNNSEIERFHVMYGTGKALTMQSQKNTIYSTAWIDADDYKNKNTDGTSCSYKSCNDEGPITILEALESATAGWSNVNTLTYVIGTTSLGAQGAYTGCSGYNSCTTNKYALSVRSAKARMITLQEAAHFGCTNNSKTCPIWLYNYLSTSTENGGTANDVNTGPNGTVNSSYWTISADSVYGYCAWNIYYLGTIRNNDVTITNFGARAIVEVNK